MVDHLRSNTVTIGLKFKSTQMTAHKMAQKHRRNTSYSA